MSKSKIHATPAARVQKAMTAYRGRLKELSPMERIARSNGIPSPYQGEELEDLAVLKAMIAEVERLSADLNSRLTERLGKSSPFSAELDKDTRIQIRTY